MHALIYCRVSTEEQAREGYSLDAQEKLCRHAAQSHGYTVKTVFRDEGKSGTSLNRPALQDLLAECQRDQNIRAVIVQETDRLARNTHDHLTIRMLLKKANVALIAVNQPMLDDSPEGNMIDTILASFNQFQSDLNARKVRKAMKEKFDTGWWPSTAPLGYMNVPVDGGGKGARGSRKILVRDPERWPLVREGFRFYLTGTYSVEAVNDTLYDKGLRSRSDRKLSHSVMAGILNNAFYAGEMLWKGERRQGNHESMITMSQHQRVLEIVEKHNHNRCRRRKHRFLLHGLIVCGLCGQRYTAEVHPYKNKSYYHCVRRGVHSNQGQNVEVQDLETQVAEHFKTLHFDERFIALTLARLQQLSADQQATIVAERQGLWNKKKAVEAARDRMEERLFKGILDDQAFSRLRSRIQMQLSQIHARLQDLEKDRNLEIDVLRNALQLLRGIYQSYQQAPPRLQRQYLTLFWEKFVVRDRRIVQAVPTKLVQALRDSAGMVINHTYGSAHPNDIITKLLDNAYWKTVSQQLAELQQAQQNLGLVRVA